MYTRLVKYAQTHGPIRVALVGAGSMGQGIAWQLRQAPGMQLSIVCDKDQAAAERACAAYESESVDAPGKIDDAHVLVGDGRAVLAKAADQFDVLVEATNSIAFAADVCELALQQKKHVVLMNAEVDLAMGTWLNKIANANGVVLTSDAGDQHGVLLRMLDEIKLWAFRPVMAGNIKGFLNRHATAKSLQHEAAIRRLNPVQCCAYTDGTKLSFEMALVANATGMSPTEPGMCGPEAGSVQEVLSKFDFAALPEEGVVDYVLGAEPGGGVFVVGHCDSPFQMPYLSYYKLGDGPYYLFYRPYHLCHLETPWAIAAAVLDAEPIASPVHGRVADVYAYAKRDLVEGDEINHAIGGDECYGQIHSARIADVLGQVPIALLESSSPSSRPQVMRPLPRDAAITWDDVRLVDNRLLQRFREGLESS